MFFFFFSEHFSSEIFLLYNLNVHMYNVELKNPFVLFQSSLFKTGGDSIQREFKEILLKHSRHVQPAILLDLATNDDG